MQNAKQTPSQLLAAKERIDRPMTLDSRTKPKARRENPKIWAVGLVKPLNFAGALLCTSGRLAGHRVSFLFSISLKGWLSKLFPLREVALRKGEPVQEFQLETAKV